MCGAPPPVKCRPRDRGDPGPIDNGRAVSPIRQREKGSWLTPFLAGVLATGASWILSHALRAPRGSFDARFMRTRRRGGSIDPVVVVPGIMGSALSRPDGTRVWLKLGNAIGHFNLGLSLG